MIAEDQCSKCERWLPLDLLTEETFMSRDTGEREYKLYCPTCHGSPVVQAIINDSHGLNNEGLARIIGRMAE